MGIDNIGCQGKSCQGKGKEWEVRVSRQKLLCIE